MDSEDATFDDVAGSVLAQYAERRDELEERYERDDLVSTLYPSPRPFEKLADASAQSQGKALFAPLLVRGSQSYWDP